MTRPSLQSLRAFGLLLLSGLCGSQALAARPPNIDPPLQVEVRSSKDSALIVSNEAYAALPQVVWAGDDARAFRGWASDTDGVASFRLRVASDATAATLAKEARLAASRVRPGGTVWFYYAGHGTVTDSGKRVLLGVDATADSLESRGLPLDELVKILEKYGKRASRIVLVLDAGFGNVGRDGLELVPGRDVKVPVGFSDVVTDRTVVWAASRDGTQAGAYLPAKHGLFTWAAVGALRGWADGEIDGIRDEHVTFGEAQAFTERTARHLGQLARPSRDPRVEAQVWVLTRGSHLEVGPTDETMDALAREDLIRRVTEAEQRIRVDAAAFWADTLAIAHRGGDDGKAALEAYISEFSNSQASLTWAVHVPEVKDALRLLLNYDPAGVGQDAAAAPTAASAVRCDDLLLLESPAMLGQLNEGQRGCLEARVKNERLQTDKSKISRLLIVNAEATGDRAGWQQLMARHLEDIDRSDPDLCYGYALFLHRTEDLDNAEEAVRWADYALENKARWEGEAYVKKVSGLLRLRAEAAARLWAAAEAQYRRSATAETEAMTNSFRGWAKDFSREWLDYAVAAGQNSDRARALCMSAAGTAAFCEAGAPR